MTTADVTIAGIKELSGLADNLETTEVVTVLESYQDTKQPVRILAHDEWYLLTFLMIYYLRPISQKDSTNDIFTTSEAVAAPDINNLSSFAEKVASEEIVKAHPSEVIVKAHSVEDATARVCFFTWTIMFNVSNLIDTHLCRRTRGA